MIEPGERNVQRNEDGYTDRNWQIFLPHFFRQFCIGSYIDH